jgi:polyphosphate kinase 2 (PPK2 family)
VLLRADGTPVDTWREGYPYGERLPREIYDRDKRLLQIELLKLQYWVKRSGQRLVIVFEGATPPARAARSSASWST